MGALLFAVLFVLGCSESVDPVPGTTLRIGDVEMTEGTELDMLVFRDEMDCEAAWVKPEERHLCTPYVDRASGQVRLGIQFQLEGDDVAYPLPLTRDNIEVYHSGFKVLPDDGVMRVEVIPHGPTRNAQLFILVIDGSGSMNEIDALTGLSRMEKVREALLMEDVVDGFFREGTDTGVMLLSFTSGQPRPVGTSELTVLQSPKRYRQIVKKDLNVLGGYTHLYDAIEYASTDLLETPAVERFLTMNEAVPTIVVLTDGFNNLQNSDTCGTNARRLTGLLESLKEARDLDSTDLNRRPNIYTVGLGAPLKRNSKVREAARSGRTEITGSDICGKYTQRKIDGDLENFAIDAASLIWIARHGGGSAYTRQDSNGLAEAFRKAAAIRYDWFEVRYQLDVAYLRRSFETKIRLKDFSQAESAVTLHPSAWLDPPPGVLDEDGWAQPVAFRHTAALVMPIIGFLISLSFLGAALYNIRRVAFGRVNPGRRLMRPPDETPPGDAG
ncbi:MAG: VWA domain-containing protein [Proteobacteria bacterium]|nr:VWA domain-containing protein [Pseudomonadota bacterium]MCP4920884.1 VWA domain-containing protein [Pseudomonadota bacterium]